VERERYETNVKSVHWRPR